MRRTLALFLVLLAGSNACKTGDPATDATCASWSRPFFGTHAQSAWAVTSVAECDLVVAGTLAGQSELGSQVVAAGSGSATYRMYLARLSGRGRVVWKKILDPGGDYSVASELFLARHSSGDVILAGTLFKPLLLDGKLLTPASTDWFLTRLTGEGKVVFSRLIGGPDQDRLEGLALGPDGSLFLVGSIHETVVDGRRLPNGGTLLRLDASGGLLGTAGFANRSVRAVDVNEHGEAALLVESVGPCPPCAPLGSGGSHCGHQCPPATASTTAMKLNATLDVAWESTTVTTEEVRFEPRFRRAGIRWSSRGSLLALIADGASPTLREYEQSGEMLRELPLVSAAAAFVPRIATAPSGNLVLVQTRPLPRVLELDAGLNVLRGRDIAAAGISVEDFAVDTMSGVLLGGSLLGTLELAGDTWDTQNTRGSVSARLDPGFHNPRIDAGACSGRGTPCRYHGDCCNGLTCDPYIPGAQRQVCDSPGN